MAPLRIKLEPDDPASDDRYGSGQLEDHDYPVGAVVESLQQLPKVG